MSSNKKTFARSAALMGIIILAAKILGLLRDVLIASAYGTGAEAVAYETASKLPINIFDFILGGVITSAFIPVYNSIAVKRGKKDALAFAQSFVNLILLITGLMALAGVIAAPWLVKIIAPGLDDSVRILASALTRIMFPMVIFVGLAFSFVGFLQSEGEYSIPALISLVSNLIMVGYMLFFNRSLGVYGLSAAMLTGWAAQALIQLPSVLKRGFRFSVRASLFNRDVLRAVKNTVPILIATWTTPVCNLINTRFASAIEGGRAITALGYANKLYIIIVGLFSFVATNLLFPVISRAVSAGETDESGRLIKTSVRTLIFIVAPISVGVGSLAVPFIRLVYERGSFTESDTLLTASALVCYSVGMVFAAVNEVLTKSFFAAEKAGIPMLSSVIAMTFNIAAVFILKDILDVRLIALLTALSAVLNTAVNFTAASARNMVRFGREDYFDIIKTLAASAAMGACVILLYSRTGGSLLSFALSIIAGAAVYAILTLLMRSDEARSVVGMFIKKDGGEQ